MAAKRWAMGTRIARETTTPGTYEDIPGLGDITGPSESVDWLDLTSHDSPNESEEGVPTIHRHGEITASLRYDPANTVHNALLTDKQTKALKNYKLIMPDPATTELQFQGYVVGLDYSFPVAGALTQNFRLRVTGAITIV